MKIIDRYNNEDAIFEYYQNFFDNTYYNSVLRWIEQLKFKKGLNKKNKEINREQIWFQENKMYFCTQWKERFDRWQSNDYDIFLYKIQNNICNKLNRYNIEINSCLVNKYNDGHDIIPLHRDNILSFGEYPVIIIYSLGCSRKFVVKNNHTKKTFNFNLKPNSIFIMSGSSQKYYKHGILKENNKDVRYSLTFRKYL